MYNLEPLAITHEEEFLEWKYHRLSIRLVMITSASHAIQLCLSRKNLEKPLMEEIGLVLDKPAM